MIRLRVAMLVMILGAVGCTQSEPKSILELDHRVPSAEGVVTEVGPAGITLDGNRNYEVTPDVESFTTQSHDVTPLSTWKNRFVQVGLDKQKKVIWVAGVGIVSGEPPQVLYTGRYEKVQSGRAYFADGTTLKIGGVKPPAKGGEVVVTLDPGARKIKSIVSQAG